RYHDPYCPALPLGNLIGGAPSVMESVSLTEDRVRQSDLVLIATDHSAIDYQWLADHARIIVDSRGVMRGITGRARIIGLSGTVMANQDDAGQMEDRLVATVPPGSGG
ncbi:MAG TPA: hypothetical protein VFL82_09690, partial [Thermomicrobiales bacterium]|nr:hypothetical protein [Thermomicrobiales bacterium]